MVVIAFFYGVFTSLDGFGAVGALLAFAAISIICTAGIALVVWIPLLLLLGAAVNGIFYLLFNLKSQQLHEDKTDQSTAKGKLNPSSNNELAIIKYIVDCRNTGTIDDTTARANLKCVGWNEVDIDNAFKKCIPQTS